MNKEILEITKKFHDMYEKLASEYTYETREDTKVFDINSNNGKLMYATVNKIVSPILKENEQLKDNWNKLKEIIKKEQDYYMYRKDNRYRGFLYKLSEKMQELEQGSDNDGSN